MRSHLLLISWFHLGQSISPSLCLLIHLLPVNTNLLCLASVFVDFSPGHSPLLPIVCWCTAFFLPTLFSFQIHSFVQGLGTNISFSDFTVLVTNLFHVCTDTCVYACMYMCSFVSYLHFFLNFSTNDYLGSFYLFFPLWLEYTVGSLWICFPFPVLFFTFY